MGKSFQNLCAALSKLPGMGKRSAQRSALHLLMASRADAQILIESLEEALRNVTACPLCGGIAEGGQLCAICADKSRNLASICLVETAADIEAIEKSGAWRGGYHVLGGKLSPIKNVGAKDLNFAGLESRVASGEISEIVLALSNDIEGEATCHYIMKRFAALENLKITRIGFGLPSGSQLGFADSSTIRSALDSRKNF